MDNRKYFKHKNMDLEIIYANAEGDCAILEEIEEELTHRPIQRARKLLQNVQNSLNRVQELEEKQLDNRSELEWHCSIALARLCDQIQTDEEVQCDNYLSS